MMVGGNDRAAHFVAIIGATGCGKTTELKKRLGAKKRPRTLIWSPKEVLDNYAALFAGSVVTRSIAEVLQIVQKAGKGGFHVVFVPTLNQRTDMAAFSTFCKIALAAGNLTMVCEELHSVTQASNAPDGWRKVNFMGRGFGLDVFGLSQRPASVDKAFMGSLSFVHVGRLPHPPDQKAMAEVIGVDRSEVAALSGFQAIQKDFNSNKIIRKK
ncbi:MAG: hypothetical protein EPO42_13290 [Gallionellaceae bacterium]|nr:MAG: hypothetical protein EPO42_13290 [Gallionellaceae bacterium]